MRLIKISTQELPEKDRIPATQDVYASIADVDIEPCGQAAVRADLRVRELHNTVIAETSCSPCISRRTPEQSTDGNDDVVLCIITGGGFIRRRKGGKETHYLPGDAYLGPNDVPSERRIHKHTSFVDVAMPRAMLTPQVTDLDGLLEKKLCWTPALMLMMRYAQGLIHDIGDLPPAMAARCECHMLDLAAMALGADQNSSMTGCGAARLDVLKADIIANLLRADLSVRMIAARHGISPQYLRALFNRDGMTCRNFVLNQRLEHAYRRLVDPRHANKRISAIAFESGFGDLSYFNRSFRQHYDMTPSEARAIGRNQVPLTPASK